MRILARENSRGFGAVTILLVIVLACLLGISGWYALSKRGTKSKTSAKTDNIAVQHPDTPVQPATLIIEEWGVKLTMPTVVADATYTITDQPRSNVDAKPVPVAYLSTKRLDTDQHCRPSQSGESGFYIVRYAADAKIYTSDTLDSAMSASSAATTKPYYYKQVGQYVYYFGTGNGVGAIDCVSYAGNGIQPTYDGFKSSLSTITPL